MECKKNWRKLSPQNMIVFYLPFFLLLSQYKIGIVSLGVIGLLIIAGLKIISNDGKVPYLRINAVLLLLIYVITRDLINGVVHIGEFSTIFHKILEYTIVYILSIYLTDVEFDEELLFAVWKIAGIIFVAGLVYQLIKIYGFGQGVSPISIIPGYELRSNETSLRPSSFFAEPASLASALLPLEFLALKRSDYKWALGTTLMIITTTSTVGIILSAVLWGLTVIQTQYNGTKKIMIVAFGAIGIWIIMNFNIFGSGISKLSDVMAGKSTVGSRIICGLDTIRTMDFFQWIFGTTYNDSSVYIAERMSKFSSASPVRVYMAVHGKIFLNSFCQLIFNYGLIGLFLYWRVFYQRLKDKEYEVKSYLIMILISIIAQSKFLNSIFFMELMIILLYDNKRKDINDESRSCYNAICE
jgi:hypothetical protein